MAGAPARPRTTPVRRAPRTTHAEPAPAGLRATGRAPTSMQRCSPADAAATLALLRSRAQPHRCRPTSARAAAGFRSRSARMPASRCQPADRVQPLCAPTARARVNPTPAAHAAGRPVAGIWRSRRIGAAHQRSTPTATTPPGSSHVPAPRRARCHVLPRRTWLFERENAMSGAATYPDVGAQGDVMCARPSATRLACRCLDSAKDFNQLTISTTTRSGRGLRDRRQPGDGRRTRA